MIKTSSFGIPNFNHIPMCHNVSEMFIQSGDFLRRNLARELKAVTMWAGLRERQAMWASLLVSRKV